MYKNDLKLRFSSRSDKYEAVLVSAKRNDRAELRKMLRSEKNRK